MLLTCVLEISVRLVESITGLINFFSPAMIDCSAILFLSLPFVHMHVYVIKTIRNY